MNKIYISSTFDDLKDHREAAYRALRRLKVDVQAMEEYVAADKRPLTKCLEDVATSDVYVGLFAWRYGYIPPRKNPDKRSITELEFRHAGELGIERLVFLTKDDHAWPANYIDALVGEAKGAAKIQALREELRQELLCDFFTTPDNFAALAIGAVSMALSHERVAEFQIPEDLTDIATIREFGSTLTEEIAEKISSAMSTAEGTRVVEVNLGDGKRWWSTRLFLLAALAETYTEVESLIFVASKDSFVGMASPSAIRNALALQEPSLQDSYRPTLAAPDLPPAQKIGLVLQTSQEFREHWADTEKEIKVWMTPRRLRTLLGDALITATVNLDKKKTSTTPSIVSRVISQKSNLVPMISRGKPTRVMDRVALATNIARSGLKGLV